MIKTLIICRNIPEKIRKSCKPIQKEQILKNKEVRSQKVTFARLFLSSKLKDYFYKANCVGEYVLIAQNWKKKERTIFTLNKPGILS